jgi:hypothetical protein
VRGRTLAGDSNETVGRAARAQAKRAFAALEQGLGAYGVKQRPRTGTPP